MARSIRLLVVGATGGSDIGGSLLRAAGDLELDAHICDTALGWRHGSFAQKIVWHLAGRRPLRLARFSKLVVGTCAGLRPDVLLATGTAPLSAQALRQCRSTGVRCFNFATDDPFNPLMHSPWFLKALPEYDVIFSPRLANLDQLRAHGCRDVRYLPFGYDHHLFYPEDELTAGPQEYDLFFAGTAEPSRLEYISKAIDAGLNVRLHGGYWERHPATKRFARGQADIPTLRRGVASSKLALCVVRHDNRDGHSMRTFELAALGACMLVEDTVEHRQIFGEDGARVLYFNKAAEMLDRARQLLDDPARRLELKLSVREWITSHHHTYVDRLLTVLQSSRS